MYRQLENIDCSKLFHFLEKNSHPIQLYSDKLEWRRCPITSPYLSWRPNKHEKRDKIPRISYKLATEMPDAVKFLEPTNTS